MLTITNLSGFSSGANRPVLTFRFGSDVGSGLSTWTYTSVSIGAASFDRVVIVAFVGRDLSTNFVTSATIGGSAATIAFATNTNSFGSIMYLPVTSGTTADIVVNLGSGTSSGGAVYVWTLTGASSSTPSYTGSNTALSGVGSVSLTPASGSAPIFVAAAWGGSNATANISWTNATSDEANTSAEGGSSGANFSASGVLVTATSSQVTGTMVIAIAGWT